MTNKASEKPELETDSVPLESDAAAGISGIAGPKPKSEPAGDLAAEAVKGEVVHGPTGLDKLVQQQLQQRVLDLEAQLLQAQKSRERAAQCVFTPTPVLTRISRACMRLLAASF